MALFRRNPLPDGVHVPDGEKVMGWGRGPRGVFIATDVALHTPSDFGAPNLVWHLIDKAVWRAPMLDLWLHPTLGAPLENWRIELSEPHKFPWAVRERVTASVVSTADIDLPAGRVRISARRTETKEIRWQVTPLDGTDLSDPANREAATAAVAEMTSALGL